MDPSKLEALKQRCRREIDEGILPACQIAVAKDGELVAFESFGQSTNDSRFVTYSTTKGVVSAAIWLLLGDGSLKLGQRVADLIPAFGANGKNTITVEQVMRHTSGFPSAFLNPFHWDDIPEREAELASWPLEWEPGSRYAYHGVSMGWVAAALVEAASGTDFRTYIRERIVQPLRLEQFQLGGPTPDALEVKLCGEMVTDAELQRAWGIPTVPEAWKIQYLLLLLNDPGAREVGIPAGGAVSTAADLAMFYQAVLSNELWDDATLRTAVSDAQTWPDDQDIPTTRGLGVQINGDHDFGWWYGFGRGNSPRAFGHDGAGSQIAWANPDNGLSFCYLTNGLDENMVRQKRRILAVGSRAAQLLD